MNTLRINQFTQQRGKKKKIQQPSFCLVYNPFMTKKKEYVIHKMEEVISEKVLSPAVIYDTADVQRTFVEIMPHQLLH